MPTLEKYRERLSEYGKNNGQARKSHADQIVESTWYNDLATRTCYLFDFMHDPQPDKLNDLTPDDSMQIPVDVKYLVYSSQTYAKDAITYHIQFKPSEDGKDSIVPYYEALFKERYDTTFPCGLYILIPDNHGVYNKWLVVDTANYNDPQFSTYEVLRCDKIFQWVYQNKKYQMPGVLRSQNSYNSGIWIKYNIEKVEDQSVFILPLTRKTECLYYNMRMIIDNKVLTEPRTWKITKVNRLDANGLTKITLAQDRFDSHKDYIELDDNGNVIGMWADYFTEGQVEPTEPTERSEELHSETTYSGIKPEIKVGGGYKIITTDFYSDAEPIIHYACNWTFAIKDGETVTPIDESSGLFSTITISEYQIKVKFLGDASYIGKVFVITSTASTHWEPVTSSVELDIKSL
ncbi:MAG: hypothetical protein LIR46_03340 [Bacteroidota bacterium]|nr:hypothetical protein [Bacteroidota bacterium]